MQEEGKEDGGHITTKKEGRWLNSFPFYYHQRLAFLSYAIRSCMHNFLSVETAQT